MSSKIRLNKYLFNRVNNKKCGRAQRSVVWLKRGQPCLHHLHVLSTVFSWQPFSSFSLWIILLLTSLPPFILSLLNQCDRCLVPLAWGLMAGGRGFASHGGVTLSRDWLCQRWKPLNIPGTHLHSVTQLLIILQTPMKYRFFFAILIFKLGHFAFLGVGHVPVSI